MNKVVLDIEIYHNYALFSFSDLDNKKFVEFEMYEGHPLDKKRLKYLLKNRTVITFNGRNFDLPITFAALQGADNEELKRICDEIITKGLPSYKTYRQFDIVGFDVDHIDLMEPSPGVKVSLKLYGGRLSSKKLQDLPIEPSATILPEQREQLRLYCRNDLVTTAELYKAVKKEIDLREQMSQTYGVDLRSLSGAQVAKAVFKSLLEAQKVKVKTIEVRPNTTFKYKMPSWINFETEELQAVKRAVEEADFVVNDKGSVLIPSELKKVIKFDGAKYKIGIGGLHSQESNQAIIAGDDEFLFEKDVASYYPNAILGQNLYPQHLTHKFIKVYKDIVDRRLEAKGRAFEIQQRLREIDEELKNL